MDDLVRWLRAQLDEDEAKAQAVGGEVWEAHYVDSVNDYPDTATVRLPSGDDVAVMERYSMQDAEHIATHDPARVLREIDAKRQVIKAYTVSAERMEELAEERERLKVRGYDTLMTEMDLTTAIHQRDALGGVLQLLALPYANRPGYRTEWRP